MQDKSTWYGSPILAVGHVVFWCAYLAFEHTAHLIYGDNHWSGSLLSSVFMMLATGALAVCYIYLQHKPGKLGYAALMLFGLVLFTLWNGLNAVLHGQITTEQLMAGGWLAWYSGGAYRFLLMLSWIGLFISGYIYLQKQTQKRQLLTAQHLAREAQLQLLMAQLNPHFLFNTLNNIYALTNIDVEKAKTALLKLSRMMRYVLYETEKNQTLLSKENEFIKDFIELMKLRLTNKVTLDLRIPEKIEEAEIAPMLLLPFIENCFKHGISSQKESSILISLSKEKNYLVLHTENTIFKSTENTPEGSASGIGMTNTVRRLELLYPGKYKLDIDKENAENQFRITLKIDL